MVYLVGASSQEAKLIAHRDIGDPGGKELAHFKLANPESPKARILITRFLAAMSILVSFQLIFSSLPRVLSTRLVHFKARESYHVFLPYHFPSAHTSTWPLLIPYLHRVCPATPAWSPSVHHFVSSLPVITKASMSC
jgi:hypothetical protein